MGQSVDTHLEREFLEAVQDRLPVAGWTHNFYRYPARFSPRFAAAAIARYSRPGDLILDPYMGGGTTVVEGLVAGRRVVGNDLNALAAFIVKVKTTLLNASEVRALKRWANHAVPHFSYWTPRRSLMPFVDAQKTRNLTLVRARFIKKAIAAGLASIEDLPTMTAQNFAKCTMLRVGQWALDGREKHTSLPEFRSKLSYFTHEMLESMRLLSSRAGNTRGAVTILNQDAANLDSSVLFQNRECKPSLVVTSPPYPGVHVLYHRWQVDGRRETPAPYWITGCNDGQGASFYNFGDRRQAASDNYFRTSLVTLKAIRRVLRDGGYMIQLVAFNKPEEQLSRYLENMEAAGFSEVSSSGVAIRDHEQRIWRDVPNRKWHATLNGKTHSAREVVLVHRAA